MSTKLRPLSEFCDLNMGQSPTSDSYNQDGDGIPFYQGNADFGELHPTVRYWCSQPTKIANGGDILISVRAPIGALNIATEKCCIGRGLAALTAKERVSDAHYLLYALRSRVGELNVNGTGSTFKAISKAVLSGTLIPDPGFDEQQAIAGRLDKTSELIALRKRQLADLDTLVKSRFVEMFGEPTTNAMGWEIQTIRGVSKRISDGPFGSNLKTEHYAESGVRVIRLSNIGVAEFIDDDKVFVSERHYEAIKKYTCRSGDLVIGTLGEPNLRACIVPDKVGFAINKADCVHFIPDGEKVNVHFVCQYINLPETLDLASDNIHGQTRSRISMSQVAALPIFVPPLPLQEKFADFVRQVDKSKFEIRQGLEKLELQYNALMQQYFG